MKLKNYIKCFLIITLTSCSSTPMTQDNEKSLRKMIFELQSKLQLSQEEILKLNGKIEELDHITNKKIDESLQRNKEDISILSNKVHSLENFQETQKILNSATEKTLQEHSDLIISVDKNYPNFNNNDLSQDSNDRLKKANDFFNKKDYQNALNEYNFFLDKPNLLSKDNYQISLYRIALSEYRLEQNEASIIHFSQLYDKFHKENDKYMASSLFHIGSLLVKSNKCSDAIEIFEQIIKQYDHNYFKNEAKKRIQQIKDSESCKIKMNKA